MTNAPEPGVVLAGKYRIEQVLGVGGMGAVVAAHHIQLDQKIAIKYLLPDALKSPEVVERFAREARAAAKIRGEHVARVIDVGKFDDGAPYMVMEYLEGHDLSKELAQNAPLRIEDVVRYILETCEALSEAHAAKIVHRDLKPQNLFLSRQPGKRSIVKVLDFGISKVDDAASRALTQTSALMGTAFYMSPEQLTTPKGVDHRSDIWSLGVILFELLAGQQPFSGETVAEIIAAILNNQPPPLRQFRPDVPPELADIVACCMRSRAADRYPSVAQLALALAPFASVADRASIEITARVLGESMHPGAPPSSARLPVGPLANTLPAVVPVTTHALARSTHAPLQGRGKTPLLVGAIVGVALLLGAGLGLRAFLAKPAERATGVVSAPPTEAPSTAALAAPALEPPPAPTASVEHPAAPAVEHPAAPAVERPVIAPAPTRSPAASPAKTAARPPASTSPPPPPPPSTAAAAASTPKNPLNMGIK